LIQVKEKSAPRLIWIKARRRPMRFLMHHGGPIQEGSFGGREISPSWPAPCGSAETVTCIPRRLGQTGLVAVYTVASPFLYKAPDFSHCPTFLTE
jgi:hypothetical protein